MRKTFFLVGLLILLPACTAKHSLYGTASMRDRIYSINRIALTKGGLTSDQIKTISSTRLPTKYPIDISIIVIKNGYIAAETEQQLISNVTREMQSSDNIKRVVPIPEFLLPDEITFSGIQELGIRTLTEYVLVFVIDTESLFKWTKIVKTKYEITSLVDFFLVDPQTTAIMASDKIFSKITYDQDIFKLGEKEKAQEEIFTEQGKIIGEKLATLFE